MSKACFVAQSGVGAKSGTWAGVEEELKRGEKAIPVYVFMASTSSEGCLDLVKKGARAWDDAKSVADNLAVIAAPKPFSYAQRDLFRGVISGNQNRSDEALQVSSSPVAYDKITTPYDLFADALVELLVVPRKEKEIKDKLRGKLDLVPSQLTHWLENARKEGLFVRQEYPKGKNGKSVMYELRPKGTAKGVH